MLKMIDVPVGQIVVVIEGMDNEVRRTFYERASDSLAKYPHQFPRFVPTYRLRTTQGLPENLLRYDSGEHRSLGMTDAYVFVHTI